MENKKCYAKHFNNCSKKISKEHNISKAALKLLGPAVKIVGFHWQESERQIIGVNKLQSKILCHNHNAFLSDIDIVGYSFHTFLKHVFEKASNEDLKEGKVVIDGIKLERWFLKTIVGELCSAKRKLNKNLVEIVFGKQEFASGTGLYFMCPKLKTAWFRQFYRIEEWRVREKMAGFRLGVGGLPFILAFHELKRAGDGIDLIYRPGKIIIEQKGIKNVLILNWGDDEDHPEVTFIVEGIEATGNRKPMVKPLP